MHPIFIILQLAYYCAAFPWDGLFGPPSNETNSTNNNTLLNSTLGQFAVVSGTGFRSYYRDSFSLFGTVNETTKSLSTLFVIGGKRSSNASSIGISNMLDSWRFDLSKNEWKQLAVRLNVSGQCSFQIGEIGYTFGGIGNATKATVFSFNLTALSQGSTEVMKEHDNAPLGHLLYPSCVLMKHDASLPNSNNYSLFIFGGTMNLENPDVCTSDLMEYNVKFKIFNIIQPRGVRPTPRRGGSLSIMKHNNAKYLVLIGGEPCGIEDRLNYHSIWWFNIANSSWAAMEPVGDDRNQSHVAYHTSTDVDENGVLIINGGISIYDGTIQNGTYVYQTTTGKWGSTPPDGAFFPAATKGTELVLPRAKHSVIYHHQRAFYYGGNDNQTIVKDPTAANALLQLSVEFFCVFYGVDCGNCLLKKGCGFCQNTSLPNATIPHAIFTCVPGDVVPFVATTCQGANETFHSRLDLAYCRFTPKNIYLLPITCSAFVLGVILIISVYVLDWKKRQQHVKSLRGYEHPDRLDIR